MPQIQMTQASEFLSRWERNPDSLPWGGHLHSPRLKKHSKAPGVCGVPESQSVSSASELLCVHADAGLGTGPPTVAPLGVRYCADTAAPGKVCACVHRGRK